MYNDSLYENLYFFFCVCQVMWFSSGGTKSVIHNDDVNNINCIFSGSKEFLFMNITKYRNQVKQINLVNTLLKLLYFLDQRLCEAD